MNLFLSKALQDKVKPLKRPLVHLCLIFNYFTVFLGDTPVEVEITQMTCLESNPHTAWNPYLYTIEVTHGEYQWTVKKRYNQFLKLHTAIMLSGRDTEDVRNV